MKVVVKVKKTGVDRAVGFNDGDIGQLDVVWNHIAPDASDHAVLHQHVPVVDDSALRGHGHHSALEEVGALVDVVVGPVAAYHVLSDFVGLSVAPSGGWFIGLGEATVARTLVWTVPPRIFTWETQTVHQHAKVSGQRGRVAVPVIQFNS